MIQIDHKFVHKSLEEYNDDVFPGIPFPLKDKAFKFTIRPAGLTDFWRFGIVLCENEQPDFNPNEGRYINNNLKFIEIHQGDLEENRTANTYKLEVQTYFFADHPNPDITLETYASFDPIEIEINLNENGESLLFIMKVRDETRTAEFNIIGFPYFKISAWADWHAFELDIQISIRNLSVYNFPVHNLNAQDRKYLELLYNNFQNNREYPSAARIPGIETIFPDDIDLANLKYLIFSDRLITLWGIWHINSKAAILSRFDDVILGIRILLSVNPEMDEVNSITISTLIPGISKTDIKNVFTQMDYYGNFKNGGGVREGDIIHISVINADVRSEYRKYRGLQQFMVDYLRKSGIKDTIEQHPPIQAASALIQNEFILNRTNIHRQNLSGIEPLFGVEDLANDLAFVINNLSGESGQMIGIFGKWGRGKSYFINKLWNELSKPGPDKISKVVYHAWKYQDTPASWAYLYEIFCDNYLGEKKSWITYYYRLFKLNRIRVGWKPIVNILLSCFAIAALEALIFPYIKKEAIYFFGATSALIGLLGIIYHKITNEYSTKAVEIIKKYADRHSYKNTMGMQAEIQEEITKLFEAWIPKLKKPRRSKIGKLFSELRNWIDCKLDKGPRPSKVFLIVEDLDRCQEDKIIANIDALRVMLEDDSLAQSLIIITAVDERFLSNAITQKYQKLAPIDANKGETVLQLVSEYMDKLFISAIKLGSLSDTQKEDYLNKLFKDDFKPAVTDIQSNNEIANFHVDQNSSNEQVVSEETNKVLEPTSKQDKSARTQFNTTDPESLSEKEVSFLRKVVGKWEGATPRKISIFYYRYLLAKNLLIDHYYKIDLDNPWRTSIGIEYMLETIRKFHNNYQYDKILTELRTVHHNENGIWDSDKSSVFKPSNMDYTRLLEVLEVVIAY